MVGGDAVALTVPEIQRRFLGADSDLLPSDYSVITSTWWLVRSCTLFAHKAACARALLEDERRP
jgi:hypothetical protein